MARKSGKDLRRGWTTGACATAAVKAALIRLWGGQFPETVEITLPRGETPSFLLAETASGVDWAEVGVTKDAGDDPDVTHGALILARVTPSAGGVVFRAGEGVGTVTRPGLPIPPGEPAINPVPRQMMTAVVETLASEYRHRPDIEVTIRVPGGAALAAKTWNPRLGITGGLSILGTTGIVRPFSCAAWIASIHRGIDVALAEGQQHVAGCTGATSEAVVQKLYGLPEFAMLDMGDFVGGMIKYLRRHPVPHLTIGGGIGKMTKLSQGVSDLHSSRSQIDFDALAGTYGREDLKSAGTALRVFELVGPQFAHDVAEGARLETLRLLGDPAIIVDTVVIDRAGTILARSE